MTKRIGVLLSGCGHRDGSEVHEATLTLLAIDKAGAEALCFAPRGEQAFVRDHYTGEEAHEVRDIFTESARIARGRIRDIANVTSADFDALVIPGGQGAALNLSSFLIDGPEACRVKHEVERVIREAKEDNKPIGAICIAPATVAKVFEGMGLHVALTLGKDDGLLSKLEQMGQLPKACAPASCIVDRDNRVVSTPAYIHATSIGEVWEGIDKLVQAIVEML